MKENNTNWQCPMGAWMEVADHFVDINKLIYPKPDTSLRDYERIPLGTGMAYERTFKVRRMNGVYKTDFKPLEFEGFINQTGPSRAVRHDMWVANQSREFYHVPYGTKCCTPFPSCYPHSIPMGLAINTKPGNAKRENERFF